MLEKTTYYPGQKSDEEILMFIHRHIIAYIKWIFILFVMFVVPIALLINLLLTGIISITESNKYLFIIFTSSYLLFLLTVLITTWIDWYLDVTIVTKKHLININQDELFSRSVAEQSLLRVQDVSAKMEGFWQKFFRVGTVYVETAGEQPNFRMTNIKHPIEVANSIMQIHEELVEEHELGEEFSDGVGMDVIKPVKKIIDEKNKAIAKDKKSKTSLPKKEITPIYEYIGDEKVISIQDPKKKVNSKSKSKPKHQEIKKISDSNKKDDDKKFKIEKTWIDNTKDEDKTTKKLNNMEDLDDLGGGEYVEDIDNVDGEIDEGEEIKF